MKTIFIIILSGFIISGAIVFFGALWNVVLKENETNTITCANKDAVLYGTTRHFQLICKRSDGVLIAP